MPRTHLPRSRGPDGMWNNFRPEELAIPVAVARAPRLVWQWYAWHHRPWPLSRRQGVDRLTPSSTGTYSASHLARRHASQSLPSAKLVGTHA